MATVPIGIDPSEARKGAQELRRILVDVQKDMAKLAEVAPQFKVLNQNIVAIGRGFQAAGVPIKGLSEHLLTGAAKISSYNAQLKAIKEGAKTGKKGLSALKEEARETEKALSKVKEPKMNPVQKGLLKERLRDAKKLATDEQNVEREKLRRLNAAWRNAHRTLKQIWGEEKRSWRTRASDMLADYKKFLADKKAAEIAATRKSEEDAKRLAIIKKNALASMFAANKGYLAEVRRISAEEQKWAGVIGRVAYQLNRKTNAVKRASLAIKIQSSQMFTQAAIMRSMLGTLYQLTSGFTAFYAVRSGVRTIIDFNQKLKELQAVSRISAEALSSVERALRSVGVSSRFGAQGAAEAMVELARAGLTVNESLKALKPTIDLALNANTDLASSSEILVNVLRQFSMDVTESAKAADILVNTAQRTTTTVTKLASSLKFVGPIAASMNQSLEETAAALGLLANRGLRASIGGTQLRGTLLSLTKITNQAEEQLRKMGIVTSDVSPNVNKLTEVFEELESKQLGAADANFIFRRRMAAAAVILSKAYPEFRKLAEENANLADLAKINAEIIDDSLNGALLKAAAAAKEFALSLGDRGLNSIMKQVLTSARNIFLIFSGNGRLIEEHRLLYEALATSIQLVTVALAEFIALRFATVLMGLGGALSNTGRVMGFVAKTTSRFSKVILAGLAFNLTRARRAFVALSLSMKIHPWVAAVGALSLLAVTVYKLTTALDKNAVALKDVKEFMAQNTKTVDEYARSNSRLSNAIQERIRAEALLAEIEQKRRSGELGKEDLKKLSERELLAQTSLDIANKIQQEELEAKKNDLESFFNSLDHGMEKYATAVANANSELAKINIENFGFEALREKLPELEQMLSGAGNRGVNFWKELQEAQTTYYDKVIEYENTLNRIRFVEGQKRAAKREFYPQSSIDALEEEIKLLEERRDVLVKVQMIAKDAFTTEAYDIINRALLDLTVTTKNLNEEREHLERFPFIAVEREKEVRKAREELEKLKDNLQFEFKIAGLDKEVQKVHKSYREIEQTVKSAGLVEEAVYKDNRAFYEVREKHFKRLQDEIGAVQKRLELLRSTPIDPFTKTYQLTQIKEVEGALAELQKQLVRVKDAQRAVGEQFLSAVKASLILGAAAGSLVYWEDLGEAVRAAKQDLDDFNETAKSRLGNVQTILEDLTDEFKTLQLPEGQQQKYTDLLEANRELAKAEKDLVAVKKEIISAVFRANKVDLERLAILWDQRIAARDNVAALKELLPLIEALYDSINSSKAVKSAKEMIRAYEEENEALAKNKNAREGYIKRLEFQRTIQNLSIEQQKELLVLFDAAVAKNQQLKRAEEERLKVLKDLVSTEKERKKAAEGHYNKVANFISREREQLDILAQVVDTQHLFGDELARSIELIRIRYDAERAGINVNTPLFKTYLALYDELLRGLEDLRDLREISEGVGGAFGSFVENAIIAADSIRDISKALWEDLRRIFLRKFLIEPISEQISELTSKLLASIIPKFNIADQVKSMDDMLRSSLNQMEAQARFSVSVSTFVGGVVEFGAYVSQFTLAQAAGLAGLTGGGALPSPGVQTNPNNPTGLGNWGHGGYRSELGNVFENGRIKAFSLGTIVQDPTYFPMRGGGIGTMAEKEPEAIVPLAKTSSGRLGVEVASSASSGPKEVHVHLHGIKDYDSFRRNKAELINTAKQFGRRF
jgi:TP901 family phage tail tape measure protein